MKKAICAILAAATLFSLRLRGNDCAGTDSRRDPCADRHTDSEAHTQAYIKPDTDSQNR